MKKILILSHQASITGAPNSILELTTYLLKHNEYQFFFLFKESGPLIENFKKLGLVYSMDNLNNSHSFFFRFL